MSFPYLRFLFVTFSALLLLSGCLRSADPDWEIGILRDETEKLSFQQAQQAFLRADYAKAVQLLDRFLRVYPQSSRLPEVRWWLARAYEKSGRLSSALEHLRFLVNAPAGNLYERDARYRVTQLEERLGKSMGDTAGKGILISLGSVQTRGQVDLALSELRGVAGDTILLDVPCRVDGVPPDTRPSFFFNAMRSAVEHIRSQEKAVYLGVTLKCLGQFSRAPELDNWNDWTYDPSSGTLRRASSYSLHFEGYKAFLADWLARLRDLPLTGLVIRNEVPVGPYEGFSPLAVRLFAREFGVDFDPARMFSDDRAVFATDSESVARLPAVFWKWAGWKARERLRIIQGLVQTLRVHLPHLEVGITVHPQSVTDPIQGLIHFAEDWIDVTRGPFDVFVMRIEGSDQKVVHPISQGSYPEWSEKSNGVAAVAEMAQHLGKPEKIWTIMASRSGAARMPSTALPKGVGRIYERRGVP